MSRIGSSFIVLVALSLSACATARLHSTDELNSVASKCGFALGQLAQDDEVKRMLFVMEDGPSVQQQACVGRWARKNHMRPVFIDGIEWAAE